jgi:hypothetical protein
MAEEVRDKKTKASPLFPEMNRTVFAQTPIEPVLQLGELWRGWVCLSVGYSSFEKGY